MSIPSASCVAGVNAQALSGATSALRTISAKNCGGPLLICVNVRNDKDRNKSKGGDKRQKRQKAKTENSFATLLDVGTLMLYAGIIFSLDYP